MDRLDKLARWYEFERRYTSERNVYERALAILARGAPENDLRRVVPLRGIARAFRLEAFYGVEGADTGGSFNTGGTGAPVFTDGTQQRRGESALTTALGSSPGAQAFTFRICARSSVMVLPDVTDASFSSGSEPSVV